MVLSEMDINNILPVTMTLFFFFILSLVVAGLTVGEGWAGAVSMFVCGVSGSLLFFLAMPVFLVSRRHKRGIYPLRPDDAILDRLS
ncbi:hypothetical protein AV903_02315 [Erwinia tracheiphila]|uniref:Uncharacterized protein n=2 Tax=Erwinia tracheiphila TaxID=65700 RepID=A0A345CP39_9GAMM|nr:hypothetical protein AV903_02315 [Erwinia tracheiphila]